MHNEAIETTGDFALAWYPQLVELAPDGILVVDTSGRIRLVNERLCAMFGYTRDELIGEMLERLVPDAWERTQVT